MTDLLALDVATTCGTEICAVCRYWNFLHAVEHDYSKGECRRRAPSPSLHVLSMIARFCGETAIATSITANLELDESPWIDRLAECVGQADAKWPVTMSFEWCGEFERRQHEAPTVPGHEDHDPDFWVRADMASRWEEERKAKALAPSPAGAQDHGSAGA